MGLGAGDLVLVADGAGLVSVHVAVGKATTVRVGVRSAGSTSTEMQLRTDSASNSSATGIDLSPLIPNTGALALGGEPRVSANSYPPGFVLGYQNDCSAQRSDPKGGEPQRQLLLGR